MTLDSPVELFCIGRPQGSPLPRYEGHPHRSWVGATTCSINLLPLPQRGCSTGRPENWSTRPDTNTQGQPYTIQKIRLQRCILLVALKRPRVSFLASGGSDNAAARGGYICRHRYRK